MFSMTSHFHRVKIRHKPVKNRGSISLSSGQAIGAGEHWFGGQHDSTNINLKEEAMKYFLKTILAISALVAITGSASAGNAFEAKLSYDRNAPIEVTYVSFLETIKKTCRVASHRSTVRYNMTNMKLFRKMCEGVLMDQAVNAIGRPLLTALHNANIGKIPASMKLAETKLAETKLASKPQP
jgi:hypothetical protein